MKLFRSREQMASEQQKFTASMAQARALLRLGRYAEAEGEARAAASARSWPLEDALLALRVAAAATSAQGRYTEALAEYDELWPDFRRIFGAKHPQTLALRTHRAQTLTALSRYTDSEAECAAVIKTAVRSKVGVMPHIAAAARNGLVYALNGQGRYEEAETVACQALGTPLPGTDGLELVLRLGLTHSLNGQGRHREALEEAERTAAFRSSASEELGLPENGGVELAMASALLGMGCGTEARAWASVAHQARLATLGRDHHRTAEAREMIRRIDGE